MAIVTISRGSYNKGKEVAEKLAERLNYSCVAREEVLKAAADRYHVPELTLARAIKDSPTLLDRLGYRKEQYVAYFHTLLLTRYQEGNVVYHGQMGHYFVRHIPHVLKVRVVADFEERVRAESERSGLSREQAAKLLYRDDVERRKWSKYLYGADILDALNFDLTISIRGLSVDDAVDLICRTVQLPRFQPTPQSETALKDAALAMAVQAAVVAGEPRAVVRAENGVVHVISEKTYSLEKTIRDKVSALVKDIPGIAELCVRTEPTVIDR
jgi:cytidylate kinase